MAYQKIAHADDLWSGEMLGLIVSGVRVLLVNLDNVFYAYEDRCAHQGVRLSEGILNGNTLVCRAHQWEYDLCRGRGINPQSARLHTLPLKIENGEVWIDVSQEGFITP